MRSYYHVHKDYNKVYKDTVDYKVPEEPVFKFGKVDPVTYSIPFIFIPFILIIATILCVVQDGTVSFIDPTFWLVIAAVITSCIIASEFIGVCLAVLRKEYCYGIVITTGVERYMKRGHYYKNKYAVIAFKYNGETYTMIQGNELNKLCTNNITCLLLDTKRSKAYVHNKAVGNYTGIDFNKTEEVVDGVNQSESA